uniref:Uncharacterized protein n=1 Tax=Zea mays TaxID=4577 RepID=A0A804NXB8_MAIZE
MRIRRRPPGQPLAYLLPSDPSAAPQSPPRASSIDRQERPPPPPGGKQGEGELHLHPATNDSPAPADLEDGRSRSSALRRPALLPQPRQWSRLPRAGAGDDPGRRASSQQRRRRSSGGDNDDSNSGREGDEAAARGKAGYRRRREEGRAGPCRRADGGVAVQPEERARVAVQPADAGGLRSLPVPPRQGPYAERERRDRRARPRPARTHRAREENLRRCAQGGRAAAAAAAERAALLEARAHGCDPSTMGNARFLDIVVGLHIILAVQWWRLEFFCCVSKH